MARRVGQQYSWDDFPTKKDDDGWHCRFCKKVLTGRKRAWCGKDCLKAVRLMVDWNYIRNKIRRRDKWKCQMVLENGLICCRPATDVDHIVELADGGSFHDLDNLRALCSDCHKIKTVLMRRLRASRRKTLKRRRR
jgi:5-methylcytosine-specific restriction protein A